VNFNIFLRSFLGLSVLAGGVSAQGAILHEFDLRSEWEAATEAITLITFTGVSGSGTQIYLDTDDDTVVDTAFDGYTNQFSSSGVSIWNQSNFDWGAGNQYLAGPASANTHRRVVVYLSPGIYSVGTDFRFTGSTSHSVYIRLETGTDDPGSGALTTTPGVGSAWDTVSTAAPGGGVGFWGITSDEEIRTIYLYYPTISSSGRLLLDNVAFGQVAETEDPPITSEVPETTTLLLCGAGLLLLMRMRNRAVVAA
jgi:hypothetical protein